MMQKITPCLWFDSKAEEAAKFYISVFKNAKITGTTYYPEIGQEITRKKPGSVLTVTFEINGQPFMALNAGPHVAFNEAISLMMPCASQAEIDDYWQKLSADPKFEQCGWLKDKFGIAWQIVPANIEQLMEGPNREAAFAAMMKMKKLDIETLKKAA